MKYRIELDASCCVSPEAYPKEGRIRLTGDDREHLDTIITGNTDADKTLTYMIDNHPGVSSAILNSQSMYTLIRLYMDLRCPMGARGSVETMPSQYFQIGQIELFPEVRH